MKHFCHPNKGPTNQFYMNPDTLDKTNVQGNETFIKLHVL